jgi:sugar phosphate isomerase/epimerase
LLHDQGRIEILPNPAPSGLRFAYSTINWGTTPDFTCTFAEIREAGWRAVELFWHALDWLGPVHRMQRLLDGLRVATLFGKVDLPTSDAQLLRMKNEIAYAAQLGAIHYGLIGGDRLRWRPPSAGEEAELARFCEELARFGAERGVQVAYHPHVACTVETEAEIDRLLDATQALTLCLDASHIALVGEDPLAHLRKYRERTSYIHLKDWARGKFVEMGEGSLGIDFAAILRELESTGFPGWVVVEQSRSDVSPLVSARKNAAYLRGLGYDLGAIG